jgi:hypothetical protein
VGAGKTIIVNFFLDDGEINATNSQDVNYGCTGRWVIKLVSELINKQFSKA